MKRHHPNHRTGSIAVLAALLMVVLMAFVAFAVDMGYVLVARTEIQRSADASAVAAAWELIYEGGWSGSPTTRATADRYVRLNPVGTDALDVGEGDVHIGHLVNLAHPEAGLIYSDPAKYNAVDITVRRTKELNGEVPFFFARALGYEGSPVAGQAMAAFYTNVRGFRTPKTANGDPCLKILPFALDEGTWLDLIERNIGVQDEWTVNDETADLEVSEGFDGKKEVDLFPHGFDPHDGEYKPGPGNRGTVDIGGADNSTSVIARQILDGISPEDLAYYQDNEFKLDSDYAKDLNGDTGISAGVADELKAIRFQRRIIPIFSEVSGSGNNAQYTIVCWAGVTILDVKLTGPMNKKHVYIQPCKIVCPGVIPCEEGDPQMSTLVYSPPWLVQ